MLVPLQARMQALTSHVQTLRLVSEATVRNPSLRASSARWWSEQELDGKSALNDTDVNDLAARLGLDIEEGGSIRSRAMAFIRSQFDQLGNKNNRG